jgi:hypothetical protein
VPNPVDTQRRFQMLQMETCSVLPLFAGGNDEEFVPIYRQPPK